jgi:WD40 repeat protein
MSLFGHKDDILSLAVAHDPSTDSCLMISTSKDHDAMIWDMHTGWHRRTLQGHSNWVRDGLILFHTDITDKSTLRKPYAVTVSDDTSCHVWDIDGDSIEPIVSFNGHSDYVYAVKYTHSFKIKEDGIERFVDDAIISVGADGIVHTWSFITGEEYEAYRIQINTEIYSLAIVPSGPDGSMRVAVGTLTCAQLYDMSKVKQPLMEYETDGMSIEYIEWIYDDNHDILLIGSDRSVSASAIVWNMLTGEKVFCMTAPSNFSTIAVYRSFVIGGCVEGQIPVWGENKPADYKRFAPNQSREVTAALVYEYLSTPATVDSSSDNITVQSATGIEILVTAIENKDHPKIHLMRLEHLGYDNAPVLTMKGELSHLTYLCFLLIDACMQISFSIFLIMYSL